MNKIILALCLLLAISAIQCEYVPQWVACDSHLGWQTYKVALDAPPVAGQNSTVTFCGRNGLVELKAQNIYISAENVIDQSFDESGVVIAFGADYCFNMNVTIPQGVPKNLLVKITFNGIVIPNLGCAVFNLPFDNSKFLGYSF